MIDVYIQIGIAILSGISIWLLSLKSKCRRWGFIVGLASEPLWIYVTFKEAQWGMFVLCIWFTYAYFQGIYNFWIKED